MWSVLVVPDEVKEDGDLTACIGCLATEGKLYDIYANNLVESFIQLVGISEIESHSPRHLCAFCLSSLRRGAAFRRSCARARAALQLAAPITTSYLNEVNKKLKHPYARTPVKTLDVTATDQPEIKQEEYFSDSDDYFLITIGNSNRLKKDQDSVKNDSAAEEKEDVPSGRDSDSEVETLPIFADSVKKEVKNKKRVNIKKERKPKKCKSDEEIVRNVNAFNFDVVFLSKDDQIREQNDLKTRKIKYLRNDKRCELCGKNFKTKRSREVHYKKYHDETVGAFSCEICHCRFPAKNRLNSHMKLHRERFHCRNCDFVTNRECGLRLHYEFHQGKKYICEFCKKDFAKVSSYMSHVRLLHANLLPWCELCGESFIGEKGVQAHKSRAHKDVEEPSFKCKKCKMCFMTEQALEKHKSLNKCDLSNCVHCGDAFASLQLLKYHLIQRHGVEGPAVTDCGQCGVSFHSSAAFQRHASACGAGAVCVQCGRDFDGEAALGEHEAREHTAFFFKCEECSRTFTNAYYFRDHCARGHERARRDPARDDKDKPPAPRRRGRRPNPHAEPLVRKWRVVAGERRLVMEKLSSDGQVIKEERVRDAVCELCGKAFALHQRLHTGEKLFSCSFCGKKFNVSTLLRNHMRVHTGERPFKCSDCPKAFKEYAGYKRHLLSHTGVRKHVCEICQKTFMTSTCVKVHIRTVHMKIPMPPRVRRPRVKHE